MFVTEQCQRRHTRRRQGRRYHCFASGRQHVSLIHRHLHYNTTRRIVSDTGWLPSYTVIAVMAWQRHGISLVCHNGGDWTEGQH